MSSTWARADAPALDVTRLAGGGSLRDVTYVFEDPSAKLDFAQVRARDRAFQHISTDNSFGFTMSAMW
ncbi:MAG TPA: 7TM-DISM domain-containing protein, partial [Polyangiales bacterium]